MRHNLLLFPVRATAALLSAVLAVSPVMGDMAASQIWSARKTALSLPALPAIAPVLPTTSLPSTATTGSQRLAQLRSAVSPAYGSVRRVAAAPSTDAPIVFHIQDVHLNSEAQHNIGRSLEQLAEGKLIDAVLLEGASGRLRYEPFRAADDRAAVTVAANYFQSQGKLSGAMRAALTSSSQMPAFYGIDDALLHARNVRAARASAQNAAAWKKTVLAEHQKLNESKLAQFNPALLAVDREVTAYRSGQLTLGDLVERLAPVAPLSPRLVLFRDAAAYERRMNVSTLESERSRLLQLVLSRLSAEQTRVLVSDVARYRAGGLRHADFYSELERVSRSAGVSLAEYPAMQAYFRYVALVERIDAARLFDDVEALVRVTYATTIRTQAEMALVEADEKLFLAGKLIDCALSPSEWARIQEFRESDGLGLPVPDCFFDFYESAEQRDAAMASTILERIDASSARTVVVVTGGFHSPGIDRILQQRGVSVITFVPALSRVETVSGVEALSIFNRERTPLDRLFQGERLFLAAHPFIGERGEREFGAAVTATKRALRTNAESVILKIHGASVRYRYSGGVLLEAALVFGLHDRLMMAMQTVSAMLPQGPTHTAAGLLVLLLGMITPNREAPLPPHWNPQWPRPTADELETANIVLESILIPSRKFNGQMYGDRFAVYSVAGRRANFKGRLLRAIYFENPTLAGMLMASFRSGSHQLWAAALEQPFASSEMEPEVFAAIMNAGLEVFRNPPSELEQKYNPSYTLDGMAGIFAHLSFETSSLVIEHISDAYLPEFSEALVNYVNRTPAISRTMAAKMVRPLGSLPYKRFLLIPEKTRRAMLDLDVQGPTPEPELPDATSLDDMVVLLLPLEGKAIAAEIAKLGVEAQLSVMQRLMAESASLGDFGQNVKAALTALPLDFVLRLADAMQPSAPTPKKTVAAGWGPVTPGETARAYACATSLLTRVSSTGLRALGSLYVEQMMAVPIISGANATKIINDAAHDLARLLQALSVEPNKRLFPHMAGLITVTFWAGGHAPWEQVLKSRPQMPIPVLADLLNDGLAQYLRHAGPHPDFRTPVKFTVVWDGKEYRLEFQPSGIGGLFKYMGMQWSLELLATLHLEQRRALMEMIYAYAHEEIALTDDTRQRLFDILAAVPEEQVRPFFGRLSAPLQKIVIGLADESPPSIPFYEGDEPIAGSGGNRLGRLVILDEDHPQLQGKVFPAGTILGINFLIDELPEGVVGLITFVKEGKTSHTRTQTKNRSRTAKSVGGDWGFPHALIRKRDVTPYATRVIRFKSTTAVELRLATEEEIIEHESRSQNMEFSGRERFAITPMALDEPGADAKIPLYLSREDGRALSGTYVGNKIAMLSQTAQRTAVLQKAIASTGVGFEVAQGISLPFNTVFAMLKEVGLYKEFMDLRALLSKGDAQLLPSVRARLDGLVFRSDALRNALLQSGAVALVEKGVYVRASSNAENPSERPSLGSGTFYSGYVRHALEVTPDRALIALLEQVNLAITSLVSDRAYHEQVSNGVDPSKAGVAVWIGAAHDFAYAFAINTRVEDEGEKDAIEIEVVPGQGRSLMGGDTDDQRLKFAGEPTRVVWSRSRRAVIGIPTEATKRWKAVFNSEGSLEEVPVARGEEFLRQPNWAALVQAMALMAEQVDVEFGGPHQLEGGVKLNKNGATLTLVQRRDLDDDVIPPDTAPASEKPTQELPVSKWRDAHLLLRWQWLRTGMVTLAQFSRIVDMASRLPGGPTMAGAEEIRRSVLTKGQIRLPALVRFRSGNNAQVTLPSARSLMSELRFSMMLLFGDRYVAQWMVVHNNSDPFVLAKRILGAKAIARLSAYLSLIVGVMWTVSITAALWAAFPRADAILLLVLGGAVAVGVTFVALQIVFHVAHNVLFPEAPLVSEFERPAHALVTVMNRARDGISPADRRQIAIELAEGLNETSMNEDVRRAGVAGEIQREWTRRTTTPLPESMARLYLWQAVVAARAPISPVSAQAVATPQTVDVMVVDFSIGDRWKPWLASPTIRKIIVAETDAMAKAIRDYLPSGTAIEVLSAEQFKWGDMSLIGKESGSSRLLKGAVLAALLEKKAGLDMTRGESLRVFTPEIPIDWSGVDAESALARSLVMVLTALGAVPLRATPDLQRIDQWAKLIGSQA